MTVFMNLLAKYLAEAIVRELTAPVKEIVRHVANKYALARR